MTTSRFADLGRARPEAAKASGDADATPPVKDEPNPGDVPDHEKDPEMSEIDKNSQDYLAGQKAGEESGFKAANERMNAVFASEHFAGREAMAAKLLNKSGMSAEDVIDVLADTPKAEPKESALSDEDKRKAAEEGGRKEMQEQLDKTNADLGAGNDDTKTSSAKVADDWAYARKANS